MNNIAEVLAGEIVGMLFLVPLLAFFIWMWDEYMNGQHKKFKIDETDHKNFYDGDY